MFRGGVGWDVNVHVHVMWMRVHLHVTLITFVQDVQEWVGVGC